MQGEMSPYAWRFCLFWRFVCDMESLRCKVGRTYSVQLAKDLAGPIPHCFLCIRQNCPEICLRPAAAFIVIQTDQTSCFYCEIHASRSFHCSRAGASFSVPTGRLPSAPGRVS